MALYLPKAQLEAWFESAHPGAKTIYARGPALDPRNESNALVRDWIDTGEVLPFQVRDPQTRELTYCIKRVRATAHAEERQRVQVDEAWRETAEGKIFLTLTRAANLGAPCPSNADLAAVAGLRNGDAARYLVYQLVEGGRIEIRHDGAARQCRRVRIVETGRWTAPAAAR